MAALEVIRRVRTIGTTENMDRVAADLSKVTAANRELAGASDATARITETTAKRQLSVSQAWDRAMASMQGNARAAQAYAKEMRLVNQAVEQGIVSEREAARFRAFSAGKLQAAGAPTANVDQTAVNALLGVNQPAANSARASAEAFEEAAREADRMAAAVTRLKAQIDPLGAAQDRLNAELAEYKAMAAAGAINSNELAAANAMAEAKFNTIAAAAGRAGTSVKLNNGQVQNLSYQLNDIGVMLASGQSPFVLLMQQGMQIAQIFGPGVGLGGAVKALGTGLMAFLTNPLTLAVAGVAALAGAIPLIWRAVTGGAVNAEEAMKRHVKIVDEVKEAYKRARDGTEEWSKAVKDLTFLQAQKNFQDMKKLADEAKKALAVSVPSETYMVAAGKGHVATAKTNPLIIEMAELSNQAAKGTVTFDQFIRRLDDIGRSTTDQKIQNLALKHQESALNANKAAQAMAEAQTVMDALGKGAAAAAGLVNNLAGSLGTAAGAAATYQAAMESLGSKIPEIAKQVQINKDLTAAKADLDASVNAASQMGGSPLDKHQAAQAAVDRYNRQKEAILGVLDVRKKIDEYESSARIGSLSPRAQAIARENEEYRKLQESMQGNGTPQAEATRAAAAHAQQLENINKQYDIKAAKQAAQQNAYERELQNLQQDTEMLRTEADAVNKSAYERDRLVAIKRLEQAADEAKMARTPQLIAQINAEAEANAAAQQKLRDAQAAQEDLRSRMDFFGSMTVDLFTGLSKGADGFKDAIDRIKDSLIQAMIQATILGQGPLAGLFGTLAPAGSSTGIGGIFGMIGSLFGVHHNGVLVGANDNFHVANDNFRVLPSSIIPGLPRYHGGMGLLPDERAAVLQTGEIVLSRRHVAAARGMGQMMARGQATAPAPQPVQITQHFDLRGVDPSMRAFVKQQVAQGTQMAVQKSVEQVGETSRNVPGFIAA